MKDQWFHKIFSVETAGFDMLALEIFRFQYQGNSVYKAFVDLLEIDPAGVDKISKIPFLPISFFKTQEVKTTKFESRHVFESSGTMGTVNSRHFVKDIEIYRQSFQKAFEIFYGPIADWCVLGLLPSYLERQGSSLVFMVNELIRESGHKKSGFYLYDHKKLYSTLKRLGLESQKTLLIGVSFALLDFASEYTIPMENLVVMETGGMKGRKREMIRKELHEFLSKAFGQRQIHSEYGMTELLSQAYSKKDGKFYCPPWMKVLLRDEEDPLSLLPANLDDLSTDAGPERGVINIIDLANVYSCSFLATDDAGILHKDGGFEVLGRIDNSDIRGCSLMAL